MKRSGKYERPRLLYTKEEVPGIQANEISLTLAAAIREIKEAATALDGYMKAKEAAIYAAMDVKKLKRLALEGFIRYSKNGNEFRFKRAWIDAYYEKNSNIF